MEIKSIFQFKKWFWLKKIHVDKSGQYRDEELQKEGEDG